MRINQTLSCRSDHSIGESTLQVSKLVETAKQMGFQSLGIVDTMSISSLIDFTNRCKKEGIKPVIGCNIRVYEDPLYRKPSKASGEVEKKNHSFKLKVYVKSDEGMRSLMNLLTKANSEEYYYYHSRVGIKEVLDLKDVIITTGDIANLFHMKNHDEIVKSLITYHGKENVFVELVSINTPLFDTLNLRAIKCAKENDLKMIVGYPCLYKQEDDSDALDVLRAITSGEKMDSPYLEIPYVRDMCFHSPVELAKRAVELAKKLNIQNDIKEIIDNSAKIADACTYEFKKLSPSLPTMTSDDFAELKKECVEGWKKRLDKEVMGYKPPNLDVYKERLGYELRTIQSLGFSTYFLVVQDIVKWTKSNGIFVGPGRGSVGGSLIAYLMGITDIDPIRFDLLFERFINPARTDLPDIDLDFMSSRRHEVVQYIINKYGQENVAGISNYSTLGTASSIRDVSRVSGLDIFEYQCSKQVEKEHGVSVSLEDSAIAVPEIAKFKDKYPQVWKNAVTLEGCMRNLGQHAAGVIVAGEPISNRAVLKKPSEDGLPVVFWDKQVVEDWGLIKMDILGLSTLDTLKLAINYIKDRTGKDINLLEIPLDDPNVMAAFGRGETVGVFQFEGSGMQKLLKQLAVTSALKFEDISAATALYRPGPIDAGLVDQFVAVKQGVRPPEYDHPSMIPALESTYGVLTYQEQIQRVCIDLAGMTATEADYVRRAMGKKDMAKMQEQAPAFIAGAVKSGMTEYSASILWDKIAGFAGYCFNKSHSIEYSVISYWCMWLKVNYPCEFYAASMTVIDDNDKLSALVLDAKKHGINVLPPDINLSTNRVEIGNDKELIAPFQAVKGISDNVANNIMKVRDSFGGKFTSKAEFEAYVPSIGMGSKVNKGHIEKLNLIGGFASIEPSTPSALSEERLRDRLEFMPGFTVDIVKATRGISNDSLSKIKIVSLVEGLKSCEKCSLQGTSHPTPRMGKVPKFMMVFDCPDYKEGNAGKMLESDTGAYVKSALKDAGLSVSDGYFTSLVKAPKPKGSKGLSNEMINSCSDYLKQEIDILKPPIIVAMGSNAVKYFAPDIKGAPADYAGKIIYNQSLDANILLGINPSSLHFDGSKIVLIQNICSKIADITS